MLLFLHLGHGCMSCRQPCRNAWYSFRVMPISGRRFTLPLLVDQLGLPPVDHAHQFQPCPGSSGQAIQNANLMLGLDEVAGLMGAPLFP